MVDRLVDQLKVQIRAELVEQITTEFRATLESVMQPSE
jgi:hypothetical protein